MGVQNTAFLPQYLIKKEVIVIKRQSELFYESANILCWFRIVISLTLAVIPIRHVICGILFALAFLSDALDGWCYRKFTKDRPYQHWFNRLPITMDPLADFCLVIGGIVHVMNNKPLGLFIALIVTAANLCLQWIGRSGSDRCFTVVMTALTYVWFGLMILVVAGAWWRNFEPYWLICFLVTMAVFYAIWLPTRVKSRTIRRRG